jgi:hypothetical protein
MEQLLSRSGYKDNGGVRVADDALGRRHIVYWQGGPGAVCNYYARVDANGVTEVPPQQLPNSCARNRKNTAIAAGPDNTAHIAVGWIGNDLVYYHRAEDGTWTATAERVPTAEDTTPYPEMASIAVSTNGLVMVAWKDPAPTVRSDVYTAIRNAPGNWTVEDISYACCTGCPAGSVVYTPSVAANYTGGFSLAWADEKCDPRTEPRTTDLYYREWVPGRGWNNQPIVRVYSGGGEAYFVDLTVDTSNTAHITWSDDSGRTSKNYHYLYTAGRGTVFEPVSRPFAAWAGSAYIKESNIDFGGGAIHTSFSSNAEDNLKEGYYSYAAVAGGPIPTNTPVVPPTPIATSTPVRRCPNERFHDVCPGDTFYAPIMSLVNLDVISGYADGTFRPNNDLTRAQASKIIALAANLPANLAGAPHFADMMDPNHPFYNYIEFAYNAGIINGYQCGGPGEPCDSSRRAYFRPNNNVTRGQLSKMTSEAFDFNEPVTGQSFTDVAPNSTFYLWIERMARRSILAGYNCGGPGEPCDPSNRAYFRPNNNVTRGQASKIIDGARLQRPTPTPMPTNTPTRTATSTSVPPTATSTATATSTVVVP